MTSASAAGGTALLTPPRIRSLLAAHDLHPTKSLGQNYLADPNTARKVARIGGATPGETVLEIGPGLGSLTLALRETGARVVAVEIDRRLVVALKDVVGGDEGIRVEVADALHADLSALAPGATRLVANLPYNIAAPLLLRVLTEFPLISSITAMVQREVGERLTAAPGTGAYGAVSVKVAALAEARVAAPISRRVFIPEPRVDSVLVRMDRRPHPALADVGYHAVARVVEAAFAQRRKTLRNTLQGLGITAEQVEAACAMAGIDPGTRAERLGVAEFAALARALYDQEPIGERNHDQPE
jgi:16S rRNA (adenine1518-N6/adenine1519-N6)-dimethyltransferase